MGARQQARLAKAKRGALTVGDALQVGVDQVKAERGQYERAQASLKHAKRLFDAYVAFHKWKAQQLEAKQ